MQLITQAESATIQVVPMGPMEPVITQAVLMEPVLIQACPAIQAVQAQPQTEQKKETQTRLKIILILI